VVEGARLESVYTVKSRIEGSNPSLSAKFPWRNIKSPVCFMVGRVGSSATIGCEPRQARKGAAVATDSGAGVWLARSATLKVSRVYA
jgi:hypothetical protein